MAVAAAPRTLPSTPARDVAPTALGLRAAALAAVAAAYALLGFQLVLGLHATAPDAVDRLAHAYLVWHGAPAKLAVVGFAVPPLPSLALLPFALPGGLATSLAALPLFGGLCGGVTIVALDRALARCGLRVERRAPLVALFALNPIVVFQFTTGTPAALELAVLAVALRGLVGWAASADPRALLGAGAGFAALVLTRYGLAGSVVIAGLLVAGALGARGAARDEIEGSTIALWAPPVAAVTVLTLLAAIILGSPFGWVGDAWRAGSPAGLDAGDAARHLGELAVQGFPLAFLAAGALLLAPGSRRDAVSAGLAALLAAGVAVAAIHAYAADSAGPLALRAAPALLLTALVGAGWAMRSSAPGRAALWWATLALLAVGGATAWRALEHYPIQSGERAWARALRTGDDQRATADAEAMGRLVRRAKAGRARILADESGAGAAILLSRRPAAFLTRGGAGSDRWDAAARTPAGRVDYLLAARGDALDRARPGLVAGRDRGALVIASSGPYVLARVVGP